MAMNDNIRDMIVTIVTKKYRNFETDLSNFVFPLFSSLFVYIKGNSVAFVIQPYSQF